MRNRYLQNEYHSIWLFASLMVIYAIVYMTKNCYSAAMVLLVNDGVLSKSQTGVISAAFYIIYAPFQIIGGLAADKYSPQKLIAIGLIGATIANVLIVFNTNYYFMLTVWTLNGAIQFGIWPAVFKMVSSNLAPVHRHRGVFYIAMASTLGLILSYLFAAVASSWRSNFVVSATALILCTLYWIPTGRFFERNMVDEDIIMHGVSDIPEYKNNVPKRAGALIPLMIKSGLILILPVAMIQTLLSIGIQSLTPSMIAESYDSVSPSLASILTVIPVVMGVGGKFVMKAVFEKVKHSECSVLAAAILISLPMLLIMLFIGRISAITMVIVISLFVLTSNGAYLIINPYITVHFSKFGKAASVSGILNSMASFGIVISNLVSTAIADNMGWKAVIISWIIFALVSAVFVIIAYFPWKKFLKSLAD